MSGKVKGKRKGSQTPRKKANTTGKHAYLRMCAKYQANRIDREKKTPSFG